MTDATPNLEQPLNINGTLRVEADGQAFDVRAEDNRVVVDLPSVGVLKALLWRQDYLEKSRLQNMRLKKLKWQLPEMVMPVKNK